jgi:chemotaxis protein CheC
MENQEFSNFELDQLKEILNIGASHASTALSQLIEKRVMITIPEALADTPQNNVARISKSMPDGEVATAVILKILGDVPGIMAFFLPKMSAHRLAHLVMKAEGNTDEVLTEIENSALKEVGNIICGAALGAFSRFMGITMLQSVSEVATDMFSAVVSTVMMEVGQDSNLTLVFKVSFRIEGEDVDAQLCFFTDQEASTKMISILKVKLNII